MMTDGLLDETKRLLSAGALKKGSTASAAIGYKECLGALSGDMTVDEAKEALRLATRHYAKRQITWFSAKEHTPIYADGEEGMRCGEAILADATRAAREFLND